MITRRDAVRLAVLAGLASPLLAACGNERRAAGRPDVAGGGGVRLVSSTPSGSRRRRAIPDVVAAMHRFAGGVYGALPTDGNLVLSPYSIAVALGMTLTGAGGTTAEEMRQVLGADDRFHAGLNALTSYVEGLAGRAAAGRRQRSRDRPRRRQPALRPGRRRLGAAVPRRPRRGVRRRHADRRLRDRRRATRGSSSTTGSRQQTHDRIEDLIPEGVLDELTRLVLVNAIYLKAPWEAPFEEQLTETRPVPPRRREHGRGRPDEQRRALRAAAPRATAGRRRRSRTPAAGSP